MLKGTECHRHSATVEHVGPFGAPKNGHTIIPYRVFIPLVQGPWVVLALTSRLRACQAGSDEPLCQRDKEVHCSVPRILELRPEEAGVAMRRSSLGRMTPCLCQINPHPGRILQSATCRCVGDQQKDIFNTLEGCRGKNIITLTNSCQQCETARLGKPTRTGRDPTVVFIRHWCIASMAERPRHPEGSDADRYL
jgi:hypothetical protein